MKTRLLIVIMILICQYNFATNPIKKNKKGKLLLEVSVPLVNKHNITTEINNHETEISYWGLSLGVDYFYSKKNNFFSLNACDTWDLNSISPASAFTKVKCTQNTINETDFTLSHNHNIKFLNIGYGIAFSFRKYRKIDELIHHDYFMKYQSLGLIIPLSINLSKRFFLEAAYKPTFFRFGLKTNKSAFESTFKFKFGWKFLLNKKS